MNPWPEKWNYLVPTAYHLVQPVLSSDICLLKKSTTKKSDKELWLNILFLSLRPSKILHQPRTTYLHTDSIQKVRLVQRKIQQYFLFLCCISLCNETSDIFTETKSHKILSKQAQSNQNPFYGNYLL